MDEAGSGQAPSLNVLLLQALVLFVAVFLSRHAINNHCSTPYAFALGQAEGSDFGFYCSRTAILPLALCVNRADTSKSYFASEKQSNPPNHGVYNSCDEGYLHECCLDRVGYYVNHHVLPDTTLLPYRRRVPELHEEERQEACLNPQAPRIASAKKLKVEVRRCLYDLRSDIDSSDTSSTQLL
ncbi:hypothetical protein KEM48_007033 [Puccinia striiformis f. sp. tritici PST-130]|nr:hypothetical protein KEM48_007033 [Puccinia striiformis f. sp. tritici PST-130]